MHSLFTRVFVSFWVAILAFAVVAMTVTAVNFLAAVSEPRAVTRDAANVLREEGLEGLKRWLTERNARFRQQRTLIVDESGRDILGQPLPRRLRRAPPDHAVDRPLADRGPPPDAMQDRARAPPGARPPRFRAAPGARIHADDGTSYVVLFDPPPRRGAFSPPFSGPARAVLLGLAIVISGLVSYLLARSISRPLVDLQGTARTLATGRLEARTSTVVASRRDEIGALAREFDSMAERLAALIAARQQLLRDLSHELRSPLARLQMAVGLARQEGADAARQIERIERESERLEGLIAQILEYARLERDPATLARQDADLADIVRRVVHDAEYESQSPPGRISVRMKSDADAASGTDPGSAAESGTLRLRADPHLLHAALDNVVRNALRYGGEGPIEVTLDGTADTMTVVVRDHGPGVPPAELERIFEPFYRVAGSEAARAREGMGIGLAVAAKAVELHGGRIVADNAVGGGLQMTISLPRGV